MKGDNDSAIKEHDLFCNYSSGFDNFSILASNDNDFKVNGESFNPLVNKNRHSQPLELFNDWGTEFYCMIAVDWSDYSPLTEAPTRGVLWKKVFLKISQNSQENTETRRLWHRFFPVYFAKFLRTPFLQSTSGWLLLLWYHIRILLSNKWYFIHRFCPCSMWFS